jgi:hypothetical protein
LSVTGEQGETFASGLRHQESVERVSMMQRQVLHFDGMSAIDGQLAKRLCLDVLPKIAVNGEFAQRFLDRDLPDCRHRNYDVIPLVADRSDGRAGKTFGAVQSPEQDVGCPTRDSPSAFLTIEHVNDLVRRLIEVVRHPDLAPQRSRCAPGQMGLCLVDVHLHGHEAMKPDLCR